MRARVTLLLLPWKQALKSRLIQSIDSVMNVSGSDEGAVFGSLITNASGSSKDEGTVLTASGYLIVKLDY